MEIRLTDILTYSGLKSARALAGINGLNRFVRRLSVYDRDFVADLEYDQGILYISSLPHLQNNPEKSFLWFKQVYESGASGLILIDEGQRAVTPEIIDFCNEEGFPVIVLDNDVTYAEIIEHISVLLYFNNIYAKNEEKIKRIVYDKLSDEELGEYIHAVCPDAQEYIKILAVQGDIASELYEREIYRLIDEKESCVFVPFEDKYITIVGGANPHDIEKKCKAINPLLSTYFSEKKVGESEIFPFKEIDKAIKNALITLYIAVLKNAEHEVYDAFSVYGLLLSAKNSGALEKFYDKFLKLVSENDASGKMEYLSCVRAYVEHKGDYGQAAQSLHQSEGTLRYRINRLKSILGFEDNTVEFNEIVSIFAAVERILKG